MSEIESITSSRTLAKARQEALKYFIEKFGHEKITLQLTRTIYNPSIPTATPQRDSYATYCLIDFLEPER